MTHREKRSLSLVLLAILLGTVNQFFLKPRFGLAVPFLSWYANDIIAGFLILAFTHYLLARGRLPALSRRGFSPAGAGGRCGLGGTPLSVEAGGSGRPLGHGCLSGGRVPL